MPAGAVTVNSVFLGLQREWRELGVSQREINPSDLEHVPRETR